MPHYSNKSNGVSEGRFSETQWDVVVAAKGKDPTSSHAALEQICRIYWYPLYSFVRNHGYGPEAAEDLTQSFFEYLLKHEILATVDPAKGKFRCFLLASLRHFLSNERERAASLKRGGGQPCLSIDFLGAEDRYVLELRDNNSPDKIFDRNWALALIEHVLKCLRDEQASAGKEAQFGRLEEFLAGDPGVPRYTELAEELNMSVDAVKKAVSRLRHRFGQLFYREVSRTVNTPGEIQEEIRWLLVRSQSDD